MATTVESRCDSIGLANLAPIDTQQQRYGGETGSATAFALDMAFAARDRFSWLFEAGFRHGLRSHEATMQRQAPFASLFIESHPPGKRESLA